MEKTNVMRTLDRLKIPYDAHSYIEAETTVGTEIAAILGQDPNKVFKTLVTEAKSGKHYVFMIPVAEELDLKKAAAAVGEKAISMLKSKELLPLTGYVHGGCSPISMKKPFPTAIHYTAADFDTILFSAGKIGYQIETSLAELQKAVTVKTADLIA